MLKDSCRKRHYENKNLNLFTDKAYMGCPVNQNHGPLIENYLANLYQGLMAYTYRRSRTLAIRFELLYPIDYLGECSNQHITQFFKGLKYRLDKAYNQRVNNGLRAHYHDLAYFWFKEQNTSQHPHYHVLILLNRDAYFGLGRFENQDNLFGQLKAAWAGALGLDFNRNGLVSASVSDSFPGSSPVIELIQSDNKFENKFNELFYRGSYLCKAHTKSYGNAERSFGSSGFNFPP